MQVFWWFFGTKCKNLTSFFLMHMRKITGCKEIKLQNTGQHSNFFTNQSSQNFANSQWSAKLILPPSPVVVLVVR